MFRVIEGGFGASSEGNIGSIDIAEQVRREGRRRLRAACIDRYDNREKITGIAMPLSLKHYKLQIECAIQALSQLSPLPVDFTQDGYWPAFEERPSWLAKP